MKTLTCKSGGRRFVGAGIVVAIVTLFALPVRAQESEALPERSISDDADAVFEPIPLMPQVPGGTPVKQYPDAEKTGSAGTDSAAEAFRKPSKTAASAAAERAKVRFRVAEIKASSDPGVQESWNQAQSAKSEAERRYALRQYYARLYNRILKLDNSVGELADQRRKESLHRLDQERLRPSVWKGGE